MKSALALAALPFLVGERKERVMKQVKPLTEAQKKFLESYFEDVLHGSPNLLNLDEDEALRLLEVKDFDDAMPSPAGDVRVARNLNDLGLFSDFDVHESHGGPHIYLGFSADGAKVMLGLLRNANAEGRLNLPQSTKEELAAPGI